MGLRRTAPGGYVIRTIPRPFASHAKVIVISSSDAKGLTAGVAAFAPKSEPGTPALYYDTFLVDVPGKRWGEVRPSRYRDASNEGWWKRRLDELAKPRAGITGATEEFQAAFAEELVQVWQRFPFAGPLFCTSTGIPAPTRTTLTRWAASPAATTARSPPPP